MERGFFITFEGPEGAGKSTFAALLATFLRNCGYGVSTVREPGGTQVGEEIRGLLKRGDLPLVPSAELLLFEASRAQLVHERILPALERGDLLICDRFMDSTVAYQGVARHLPLDFIHQLNRFAIGPCVPDLTLFLDIDPVLGFQRIRQLRPGGDQDRIEQESLLFHQRVRSAYQNLARQETRIVTIDASQAMESVESDVICAVARRMQMALERFERGVAHHREGAKILDAFVRENVPSRSHSANQASLLGH